MPPSFPSGVSVACTESIVWLMVAAHPFAYGDEFWETLRTG